jgi:hypothetical protein
VKRKKDVNTKKIKTDKVKDLYSSKEIVFVLLARDEKVVRVDFRIRSQKTNK